MGQKTETIARTLKCSIEMTIEMVTFCGFVTTSNSFNITYTLSFNLAWCCQIYTAQIAKLYQMCSSGATYCIE